MLLTKRQNVDVSKKTITLSPDHLMKYYYKKLMNDAIDVYDIGIHCFKEECVDEYKNMIYKDGYSLVFVHEGKTKIILYA